MMNEGYVGALRSMLEEMLEGLKAILIVSTNSEKNILSFSKTCIFSFSPKNQNLTKIIPLIIETFK